MSTTTPKLGMISIRNQGTLADSYISKDATKISQANTVGFVRLQRRTSQADGFHRLLSQAISLLGFTGFSAKLANGWIYQTAHSKNNTYIKDQPSKQMHLSGYSPSHPTSWVY